MAFKTFKRMFLHPVGCGCKVGAGGCALGAKKRYFKFLKHNYSKKNT